FVIVASRAARAFTGARMIHIADPATIVHVLYAGDVAPLVGNQLRTEDLAAGGALHPAHRPGQGPLLLLRGVRRLRAHRCAVRLRALVARPPGRGPVLAALG